MRYPAPLWLLLCPVVHIFPYIIRNRKNLNLEQGVQQAGNWESSGWAEPLLQRLLQRQWERQSHFFHLLMCFLFTTLNGDKKFHWPMFCLSFKTKLVIPPLWHFCAICVQFFSVSRWVCAVGRLLNFMPAVQL